MPDQDAKHAASDTELLSRLAAGEESAFRVIFNRYKNRIFAYALTVTQSHDRAEEITQEFFIKLWTSRHLLASVENLDHYLFVMARMRTISALRDAIAAKRKMAMLQASDNLADNPTEAKILDSEYQQLLKQAVNSLSPQRQQVYLLSREGNLSLNEIATKLNLSRNTVKNHLVEALKQIRSYLAEHGIGTLLLFCFEHFLQ